MKGGIPSNHQQELGSGGGGEERAAQELKGPKPHPSTALKDETFLPCGGTNGCLSKVCLGKAPGRQQSCLNITWKPKQMVGMALKTDTQEEGLRGGRGAALTTAGSFPSQAPHQKGVQKMSQPSPPQTVVLLCSSRDEGICPGQATGGPRSRQNSSCCSRKRRASYCC